MKDHCWDNINRISKNKRGRPFCSSSLSFFYPSFVLIRNDRIEINLMDSNKFKINLWSFSSVYIKVSARIVKESIDNMWLPNSSFLFLRFPLFFFYTQSKKEKRKKERRLNFIKCRLVFIEGNKRMSVDCCFITKLAISRKQIFP